MADAVLFDTSIYIAYIRRRQYGELMDRATEGGRVVLSSVVTMELYAGARSATEKRLLDQYVASMKRMSAYETPREDDWARGGVLVERYTRLRGHAGIRGHFRDILVVLTAIHRNAILVSSNAHLADWRNLLRRQGEILRLSIV